MYTAKITKKNQITIPERVMKVCNLTEGDFLVFGRGFEMFICYSLGRQTPEEFEEDFRKKTGSSKEEFEAKRREMDMSMLAGLERQKHSKAKVIWEQQSRKRKMLEDLEESCKKMSLEEVCKKPIPKKACIKPIPEKACKKMSLEEVYENTALEERKTRVHIAKKMIKNGFSSAIVARCTELIVEEVEEIKKLQ
ncbi:hypothetical protein K7432_010209 [Basidiobolus ranarum]|uniref:SpoVT-AbrB domain-containing protein n=1 Tax=Basidiobolus ranarum TaxID=34480 RepID=A0ABR2WP15_9FUNG